jgi:hypothetical protein
MERGPQMKVASFTVGATAEQSRRWKMAAEADGHRAVGSWLAVAADLYLKVRARAGNPIPLAWHRGRFRVLLEGEEWEVQGHVSRPFAIYCGTAGALGYAGRHRHTLIHVISREVIATLRTAKQARSLAAELAPAWLRDRELAAGIVERHQREST